MRLLGWTSKFVVVAAAAVALPACGDVKASPDAPDTQGDAAEGDFTLSVDPTSLSIPIAGSATATVTIARTGAVGDVMLSASGLGSNLEVEFSPNPIPAGSTTTTATIRVKGGTAAASSTVTLTGTAGDKTHSATIDVTSTTITVTGTVRGNRAGVRVGIIGKQSLLSGAGGVFSFTDVTPPYDLYTVADAGCTSGTLTPTVYFFDDLTRTDPTVTAASVVTCSGIPVLCGILGSCPNSNISGTRTGAGNNTDEVVFAWSEGSASGTLGNGTYTGNVSWSSGNTSIGFLHALQLTRKPNGAPNAFLGYVRSGQTTLTSGQASTVNLAFSTVNSTAGITGTLTGPSGYAAANISLQQAFGNRTRALWTTNETTTIDANFPLIASAGGNNLYAYASLENFGSSYFVQPLTGTATVNFEMPTAAVLTAPADAATGVTTTTPFTFTAPPTVISEVSVDWSNAQGTSRASFHIFTRNAQVTLPVIPELALPGSQSFSWRIFGYGPNSSINDAAGANELEGVTSNDYLGPAHAQTISVTRSFTTL